jgi:hypothetical protein
MHPNTFSFLILVGQEKHQHKPVLATGKLIPKDLTDPEFSLRYPGILLRRSVEMYQWSRVSETLPRLIERSPATA